VLLAEVLVVTIACSSTNTCAIISSTETSLAMQVINLLKDRPQNNSFTFYIQPGTYNATNGTQTNFYNFSNVTFQKDPNFSEEVVIRCPNLTDVGDFNSLGFFDCTDISIFELTFTQCGQKSFGVYFENVKNLYVVDSTFHHNQNNGLGVRSGTNVTIINCTFEMSVGLQNDSTMLLVQQSSNIYGGAGLGISLQNTTDSSITVENCTFRDSVALKRISDGESDSRPYSYIPFGNGGGVYIHLNNVKNVTINITNCRFYNNTALHQGGGIVIFMIASYNNLVKVTDCDFIGNKAIGHPLVDQINKSILDHDKFITEINSKFNIKNFNASIRDALSNISSETILETGGFGGAIVVNIFRDCENNKVLIKKSNFEKNSAIAAAAIGFFIRDGLSSVSNGVNSNRAWISRYAYRYNCIVVTVAILCSCKFFDNHGLLGGSAMGFLSRTRIDITNVPTVIENWLVLLMIS